MVGQGSREFPRSLPVGEAAAGRSDAAEAAFLCSWKGEIERAARRVAGFIHRAGADDADDVAQEMRIRLLKAFRAFGGCPPDPYIRQLLKNAGANSVRDDRHHLTLHNGVVAASLNDQAGLLELFAGTPARRPRPALQDDGLVTLPTEHEANARADVTTWVSTLPGILRHIYALLYVRDLKQCEVALSLGVTSARISQLHQEILARGARELGPVE